MKKTTKKLVAVLVALVMMVTCLGVSAFATWGRNDTTRTANTMVVLGDSIASGYGLNCDPSNPYTVDNQMARGHGDYTQGSYAQIVADTLGVTNRYNYARDMFRSEEVRRLIDPEYESYIQKYENSQERFLSDAICMIADCQPEQFVTISMEAQQTIPQADIIVLNFGNNDGGTYGFVAPFLKTMYYTYGLSLETATAAMKGQLEMLTSLDQYMTLIGGYADYMTEMENGKQNFYKNYDAIIKRLRELNPHAEIYFMGMYDCFKDLNPQDNQIRQFLSDQAVIFDTDINNYVQYGSPYANEVTFVACPDVEMWDTADFMTPQYFINFLISVHPNFNGHYYMAGNLLRAINSK